MNPFDEFREKGQQATDDAQAAQRAAQSESDRHATQQAMAARNLLPELEWAIEELLAAERAKPNWGAASFFEIETSDPRDFYVRGQVKLTAPNEPRFSTVGWIRKTKVKISGLDFFRVSLPDGEIRLMTDGTEHTIHSGVGAKSLSLNRGCDMGIIRNSAHGYDGDIEHSTVAVGDAFDLTIKVIGLYLGEHHS